MSELYTDPNKIKKELGRHKTDNFLQDTFTDWVTPGLSIGDDGHVKREGAAWWLQAFTPGAKKIANANERLRQANIVRNEVISSGLDEKTIAETAAGRTLTPDNVRGIIKTAQLNYQTPAQKEEAALRTKERNAAISNTEKAQSFQEALLTSQQNWQREEARNRWQDKREQRKEEALTRELNAQNNAMQLQLEYSRLERQDRQARQDRRDRMILMLAEGLRNLGSAFTI